MTDKNGNKITVGCRLIGYFKQDSGGIMPRLLCVPRMTNIDKEIFTVYDSNCLNPLPNSTPIFGMLDVDNQDFFNDYEIIK